MHAMGPSDADLLTVAKLAAAAGAKVRSENCMCAGCCPVLVVAGHVRDSFLPLNSACVHHSYSTCD